MSQRAGCFAVWDMAFKGERRCGVRFERLGTGLFVLVLSFFFIPVISLWAASTAIKVDQVGYLPTENPKLAMITSGSGGLTFYVIDASAGTTVYTGTSAATTTDTGASGDIISIADFTPVSVTGTYYLSVVGVGTSYPFTISPTVYADSWRTMMRAFYAQRCGTAVTMGTVGGVNYHHDACHTTGLCSDNPSIFHSSSGKTGTQKTLKGWHDAGDYGKYIVNSGISTGQVLWTYEFFNDRIGNVNLAIPESGNGTPDILNEARWNLEWMLTMQDTDGGVWPKNTSAWFGSFVLPENDDSSTRYIIGTASGSPYKTTAATADFAAVMAIAARLYQPYDASFATQCLSAAVTAWGWLQNGNKSVTYVQPVSIYTGEYGDTGFSDELLWASAELFHTTGDAAYNTYFTTNLPTGTLIASDTPQGWGNVQHMAYWTYYFSGQASASAAARSRILSSTTTAANTIVARTNAATSGYRVSLVNNAYWWGSNGVVANYGVVLLIANQMQANTSYIQAAINDLHYLLGRNTFGLSWVTHVGSNSYLHPHHRPSGSPEYVSLAPWPGLLSGGPNSTGNSSDGVTPANSGNKPAKCYVDDTNAYASNEVAINWQAPLVFLVAGLLPAPSTPTPTVTFTWTNTPTPSTTPTITDTPTWTGTPTVTNTQTETPTGTWYTATATPTPTFTATPTSTETASPTITAIPTDTAIVNDADVLVSVPYPNPAYNGTSISVNLVTHGPKVVQWSVLTVAFRRVAEGRVNVEHNYTLSWDLNSSNGSSVANGMYYLVLEIEGTPRRILKVVVAR
jgi:endoglucanase